MTKRKRGKPKMLSITEAAKRFGYSRAWVQKLLINGTLKGEKDSRGYWRVSASAMQGKEKRTWIKRQRLAAKRPKGGAGPQTAPPN